jgi:hypothetical protein
MPNQEKASLHAGRALEELDRARAAASPEAAIAHLGLSELHRGRMKSFDTAPARVHLRIVND